MTKLCPAQQRPGLANSGWVYKVEVGLVGRLLRACTGWKPRYYRLNHGVVDEDEDDENQEDEAFRG